MNDFSELENELRKLRPAPPSPELFSRIEQGLLNEASQKGNEQNIIRPDRFRFSWQSLGLGLATAAVLLLLVRMGFQSSPKQPERMASSKPSDGEAAMPAATRNSPAAVTASSPPRDEFVPAGTTRLVYHMGDEGLFFPDDSQQPMRRFRSRTRETLQWRNSATGASLRVSYPSEEIQLIPVSGQ